MSQEIAAASGTEKLRQAPTGFSWPMVAIAFVVIAAFGIAKAIIAARTTPLINDTDDAMRLVVVHDLMNGQSWWDHLQHRLNAPFGAELHWSRLVDVPIAALDLLFRPFGPLADTLTVYVWPLLLLFGLLSMGARLAYRLAGREAMLAALILPALSPALMTEFSPGRIDHDSVQILLLLAMVWGTIESVSRPRLAILAGIAAAASLAIGIEGLPGVLCAIIAMAMLWVVRPETAPAMRHFGLALAIGTVAAQINQYPPGRWFEAACDEISFTYVAFGVGVGAVLTLLSLLPLPRRVAWLRFAIGVALGAVLAVALAKAFPLCLRGPYAALDPWLVENWLNQIIEAKPVWISLAAAPALTIGVVLPPVLGLLVIVWRVLRDQADRAAWLILGLFLALAIIVMVAQVRGARLALPAAGWLIAAARRRYLDGAKKLTGALAMVASWLGFAGLALAVVVALGMAPFEPHATAAATPEGGSDAQACLMPAAFTPLAALPPARVMSPIDLASHILLFTPHAVIGAPYHRDQTGVLDTFRFFNGPIDVARQILAQRGVSLVVICPTLPEMAGLASAAPDSFVKLYARRLLPGWLTPISGPGGALKMYQVLP
jgi:hypothetical protein